MTPRFASGATIRRPATGRHPHFTATQIVAFVENDTFDFAPGTAWRYNSTGYVLLGMILEKVTGTPYAEHAQSALFAPLGLRTASYCPSRTTDTTHAVGYDARAGGGRAPYLSMTHPYAAGALCMTARDYLRWQAALTGGRVVRPATIRQMITPDTLANGRRTQYGYALFGDSLAGHLQVSHNGGVHGFSAEQSWFPNDSLRVVVFTNSAGSEPDRLSRNLASAVLGLPLTVIPKPPKVLRFPPTARATRARAT